MFYDYFVCRFFRGRLKKSKWLQKTHFFGKFVVDNVWEIYLNEKISNKINGLFHNYLFSAFLFVYSVVMVLHSVVVIKIVRKVFGKSFLSLNTECFGKVFVCLFAKRTTVKQGFSTHKKTGWRRSHEVSHNFPDLVLCVCGDKKPREWERERANWKVLIVPCGIK